MDSYVVRIYRRDPKEPRRQAGTVERAGAQGREVFHDLEELLDILEKQAAKRRGRKAAVKDKAKEAGPSEGEL
jgi:hypothetical protein